jgi:pre-mRNA-processing factor 17
MPKGDAANNAETYLGPWAGYEDEELPPDIEQEASEEELARLREFQQRTRDVGAVSGIHAGGEFSTFHGTEEKDYLGRTYIDIPKDVDFDLTRDPGDHDCYTPKALIHTWYIIYCYN